MQLSSCNYLYMSLLCFIQLYSIYRIFLVGGFIPMHLVLSLHCLSLPWCVFNTILSFKVLESMELYNWFNNHGNEIHAPLFLSTVLCNYWIKRLWIAVSSLRSVNRTLFLFGFCGHLCHFLRWWAGMEQGTFKMAATMLYSMIYIAF